MHPSQSLLDDLQQVIERHVAHGPEERFEVAAWRGLGREPTVLTRAGDPAHFTASAVPVDPTNRRVCLVLHAKLDQWVQPGGHMEPGDDTVGQAALRELQEETGLAGELDPRPLLLSRHPSPCGVGDWHLDVQLLVRTTEVAPVVSDESHDVAWFDLHDLPTDMAPGVGDLVAAAATRIAGT